MRTQIKGQVHLVSTGKTISHGLNTGDLSFSPFYQRIIFLSKAQNLAHGDWIGQHLYFTTDEEIKEGDWCLVMEALGHGLKISNKSIKDLNKAYLRGKIVATTNPELWKDCTNYITESCNEKCLKCITIPKIDIPFIEAYIKAYNESNPIKEVMLETQQKYEFEYDEELKLKPNGSVIIHPIKEKLYTRDELENAVIQAVARTRRNYNFNTFEWLDKCYPK